MDFIDKAKLVMAVREYPCLWKTSDSNYKDMKAKEVAWKEVTNQVGGSASVEKCMTKWKSIRDRFVRELKRMKQEQTVDPSTSYTPPWQMFNELMFLHDSVRHRTSNTPLDDTFGEQSTIERMRTLAESTNTSITANLDGSIELDKPPLLHSSPSPTRSNTSNHSSLSPPPSKKAKSEASPNASDILLQRLIEIDERERELHDEEGLFGQQVAANLRRLSSRQKAAAKIKIQEVLLEIEFPKDT